MQANRWPMAERQASIVTIYGEGCAQLKLHIDGRELYRHLEKVYDERIGEPHGTEARRLGFKGSE